MRKGHSIIGLQVISSTDGTNIGHIIDLFFDHDADQCLGLVMRDKDLFGLISPQVIPWESITSIGKDAIMVAGSDVAVNPASHPRLKGIWQRSTALSGTRIFSEDGRDLGNFSEVYIDENSGRVVGYEVSGGFVSDTMSGKRYVAAEKTGGLHVGQDVLLAETHVASEFDRQQNEEPGGLKGAVASASESATHSYDAAKSQVTEAYGNLANASVEKQQEFVVGKTAGHDVYLTDKDGSEVEARSLLIAQGETITAGHAQRATEAGILHQLVTAASGGTLAQTYDSARSSAAERWDNASDAVAVRGQNAQEDALERAIGQQAALEVDYPNGSTLLAPGMTITREVVEQARLHGKENEVIASAGLGTASNQVQSAGQQASVAAGSAWDAIKTKTEELFGAAQDKKAEYDAKSEQNQINHALGRPVTRVILAQDDAVILNTGDIITHKAVERARAEGVLDVLLDSVYDSEPKITPEMMRVNEKGEASLDSQAQPHEGPITATVPPEKDQVGQPVPSQG